MWVLLPSRQSRPPLDKWCKLLHRTRGGGVRQADTHQFRPSCCSASHQRYKPSQITHQRGDLSAYHLSAPCLNEPPFSSTCFPGALWTRYGAHAYTRTISVCVRVCACVCVCVRVCVCNIATWQEAVRWLLPHRLPPPVDPTTAPSRRVSFASWLCAGRSDTRSQLSDTHSVFCVFWFRVVCTADR